MKITRSSPTEFLYGCSATVVARARELGITIDTYATAIKLQQLVNQERKLPFHRKLLNKHRRILARTQRSVRKLTKELQGI